MPLRMLQYFNGILSGIPDMQQKLYGREQAYIPAPMFYMLYNGSENVQQRVLRLSDAYVEKQAEPQMELIVQVVDIRYNSGSEVLTRSPALYGYAMLVGHDT